LPKKPNFLRKKFLIKITKKNEISTIFAVRHKIKKLNDENWKNKLIYIENDDKIEEIEIKEKMTKKYLKKQKSSKKRKKMIKSEKWKKAKNENFKMEK